MFSEKLVILEKIRKIRTQSTGMNMQQIHPISVFRNE